ncbi:MAG: hypothetical protein QXR03_01345 [Candidatus Aenigmatarchaeota archaeon]
MMLLYKQISKKTIKNIVNASSQTLALLSNIPSKNAYKIMDNFK